MTTIENPIVTLPADNSDELLMAAGELLSQRSPYDLEMGGYEFTGFKSVREVLRILENEGFEVVRTPSIPEGPSVLNVKAETVDVQNMRITAQDEKLMVSSEPRGRDYPRGAESISTQFPNEVEIGPGWKMQGILAAIRDKLVLEEGLTERRYDVAGMAYGRPTDLHREEPVLVSTKHGMCHMPENGYDEETESLYLAQNTTMLSVVLRGTGEIQELVKQIILDQTGVDDWAKLVRQAYSPQTDTEIGVLVTSE